MTTASWLWTVTRTKQSVSRISEISRVPRPRDGTRPRRQRSLWGAKAMFLQSEFTVCTDGRLRLQRTLLSIHTNCAQGIQPLGDPTITLP